MTGINKVIIVGNLGRDPEVTYTNQGTAIVKLVVATSDAWQDNVTGESRERTEWHRVTVFGKAGENCARYLSKGRQVYVEGKLQTSTYEKEGQRHYSTEIIANIVQFLGRKEGQDTPYQKAEQQPEYLPPNSPHSMTAPESSNQFSELFEDKIPF